MPSPWLLPAALALDAVFGEPRWLWSRLPHPAVLMGRSVAWADARFNRGGARRARGAAVIAVLALAAWLAGAALAALPGGAVLEVLAAAMLLAQRSLAGHVADVARAMTVSTAEARAAVARIVSRDTAAMGDPAIARAAIESAAENLSDGVVAPAFWFVLFGLPGMAAYKLINTADSMIGYRSARHRDFGWAAARLDDLVNWVPARLTALLILAAHLCLPDPGALAADARRHRSPNAGWPEAAMARVLGVALAGPRSYDGQVRDFAWVNAGGRRVIGAAEITASVAALWRSWALGLALCLVLAIA